MSLFFDLSKRTKLRVSGPDAERFLNGQLTNDLRKATDDRAIQACVLNNKGKLNAYVSVTRDTGSFLFDAEPELRDSLQPRLDRYIIADDVQIEDVTERLDLFHVLYEARPDLSGEWMVRPSNRFAEHGYDIWAKAEQHEELLRRLSNGFRFCDAACAERLRIERGIPRWGRELTEDIIPIEANLESQTIDYEKGCYIGQEVISRMKMSGQTNKRLCGLTGEWLEPGMKLIATGTESKEVGFISSVAESKAGQIALGFVKRGFNSAGTSLHARSAAAPDTSRPVQITDLPFRI
jgi:folate-binding protein YgfZ